MCCLPVVNGGDPMLLNLQMSGAVSTLGLAINRAWIVKGTGSNRPPAIEGYDFTLTENDSLFKCLRDQWYACNMLPTRVQAGKTLYFRIHFNSSVQIAVWGNLGSAFYAWYNAGWHTVKCEYFENGQNRYTIDGVVRYSGPNRGVPDFYWGGVQTLTVDIGNRGGVLPAGCEWW